MRASRVFPLLCCALGASACAGAHDADAPLFSRGARGDTPTSAAAPADTPTSSAARDALSAAGDGAQAPPETAERAAEAPAPRLTSRAKTTWIWPEPSARGTYLGYVRVGNAVPARSTEPVQGDGCNDGFIPVAPRGWVCTDRTATFAPDARLVEAARATRAAAGPFPYRYAISSGAPMYNRIPTAAEQARFERGLRPAGKREQLPRALAVHEDLASDDAIAPSDPLPSLFAEGRPGALGPDAQGGLVRRDLPVGSMVSFARAFAAEGRTWLLSPDLTLVPADRVRPFRASAFHGTRLGGEVSLPIAWVRKTARPRYRRAPSGEIVAADGELPVRSFVRLATQPGALVAQAGVEYLETRERFPDGAAVFIARADATVVEPAARLAPGVAPTQKWILVRITRGTLVAYEGLTPVYATLMSPGSGGVSVKGRDPVKASTTPRGTFYVTFKDRASLMSPDKEEPRGFWIADVPYAQYFDPPFALHAAYWHERFGELASAGCINVSPIDAEALFSWSDPQVPDGWQGATGAGAPENGPTTAIVVHR